MRTYITVIAALLGAASAAPQGGLLDTVTSALDPSKIASALDPSKLADKALSSVNLAFFKDKCPEVRLKPGVCAILFEEDGCTGDFIELEEGAGNLPESHQNKHESVVVAAGASFRGYDDTAGDVTEKIGNFFSFSGNNNNPDKIENLGKVAILSSFNGEQVYSVIDDLEDGKESDEDLEETIEAYSCAFGTTAKCPAVPEHLCAIGYPRKDCSRGLWNSPLEIPVVDDWSLGRFGGGRNALQAVSVRKGCTLTLKDTDTFGNDGQVSIKGEKGKDKHVNLEDNADPAIAALSDDAENVICSCPGETVPVFSKSQSKINVGK